MENGCVRVIALGTNIALPQLLTLPKGTLPMTDLWSIIVMYDKSGVANITLQKYHGLIFWQSENLFHFSNINMNMQQLSLDMKNVEGIFK